MDIKINFKMEKILIYLVISNIEQIIIYFITVLLNNAKISMIKTEKFHI